MTSYRAGKDINLERLIGFLAGLRHTTAAGTYLTDTFMLMTTFLTICVPRRHERASTGEVAVADAGRPK